MFFTKLQVLSLQQPGAHNARISLPQKKMKKKKIIFSTSGGTPAMRFLACIIDHFGHDGIEQIAAQIAATCRKSPLTITVQFEDGIPSFYGSTAKSIGINADTLELSGENLNVEDSTLSINQQL